MDCFAGDTAGDQRISLRHRGGGGVVVARLIREKA